MSTKKICRVCMRTDRVVCLFSAKITVEKKPLYEVFMDVINIPISERDGLPSGICFNCCTRVKEAFLLKKQAQESFESLMKMNPTNTNSNTTTITTIVTNSQPSPPGVSHFKIVSKTGSDSIKLEDDGEEDVVEVEALEKHDDDDDAAADDEVLDAVEFLLENKPVMKAIKNNTNSSKKAHVAERKHECQVCFKRFLRKSNLVDHLRLHANVKPFKCEYCSKSFVQSGNYKAHLRTHTNERPYICQFCSKSYNQSSALKIHVRTHTNEKNYICDVCQKGFTNSSDLSKHRRVHDPNLKIKCDYCEKSFAQKANLRLHQANYHQVELLRTMKELSK